MIFKCEFQITENGDLPCSMTNYIDDPMIVQDQPSNTFFTGATSPRKPGTRFARLEASTKSYGAYSRFALILNHIHYLCKGNVYTSRLLLIKMYIE